MKRVLAALFAGIMTLALAGCSGSKPSNNYSNNYTNTHTASAKPKSFKDLLTMRLDAVGCYTCKTVDGNTVHYKIYFGSFDKFVEFTFSSNESLKSCIKKLLQPYSDQVRCWSAKSILLLDPNFDGMKVSELENTEYDFQKGQIKSKGEICIEFFQDNTIKHGDDIYKRDDELKEFSVAFKEAMAEIFTEKYGELATHKDVKYDPMSYLGKYFVISGTAELDDYYNYDYSDLEFGYFCVCITPTGGGYTDRWYIYCDRNKYNSVLNYLKGNETTEITMVCKGIFPDSLKEEMANLVDCYFES